MAPGPLLDVALPAAPALVEKTQEVADEVADAVLAKGWTNQEVVDYAFKGGLITAAAAAAVIAQSKVPAFSRNLADSCIGKSQKARCICALQLQQVPLQCQHKVIGVWLCLHDLLPD